MTTRQRYSGVGSEQVPAERPSDDGIAADAEEHADLEEDRRRQQDLDYGELGGEC